MSITTEAVNVSVPDLTVMMDKELGERHPSKMFYLRIAMPDGGEQHIDLDDAVTPVHARRLAREKGYEPTHWMRVGDHTPMQF